MRLRRPVFIVGCGRSGTTALGELLSHHPALVVLNEPREVWRLDPRTDIWSAAAGARGGRLRLTASDVTPAVQVALPRAFAAIVFSQPGERLVEKLPINSFRIGYLATLFPDALFVHLARHGVEVARSIAREAGRYAWFGHEDYKWHLLATAAAERGLGDLAAACGDDSYARGLLEWRLSVGQALESLAVLPAERLLTVRYEAFVQEPEVVAATLQAFIGVPVHEAVQGFARERIARRTRPAAGEALAGLEAAIAGELLQTLGYE